MNRYEHTQLGHVIIWSLLPFIVLVGSGAFVGSLYHRQPPLVVLIILVAALLLFYKLTIKIEDETLCASLGIGIIRKRIRLADIAGREAIWIRWWYGWGIHLTPYGWLYNVSGFDAVAITLRDGRKFALGTNDPGGLTAAIQLSGERTGCQPVSLGSLPRPGNASRENCVEQNVAGRVSGNYTLRRRGDCSPARQTRALPFH